jgi:hypothetical protein
VLDDQRRKEAAMTSGLKQLMVLCGGIAIIVLFWSYPVMYPLKLLVVFFHESSHALMTVMTGGEVTGMVVDRDQGGHVVSRGGDRVLVLNAGYLGSLVWGMLIYLGAVRSALDKALMFLLGLGIMVIAGLFVRELFSLVFSLLAGSVLLVLAIKASMIINDVILRLIGLTSMIYVPLDIYSDTIERSHLRSDAFMLAEEVGGTTLLWGITWAVVSALLVLLTLWLGYRGGDQDEDQSEV